MVSQRKIAANRRNALRSTGPRTPDGKARASANARRHGLSANPHHDAALSAQVDELARAFAGDTTDPNQIASSKIAAEAELCIRNVRAARVTLIKLMVVNSSNVSVPEDSAVSDRSACDVAAFAKALPQLEKIDRYERRAISRRKRAIRAMA